MLSRMPFAVLVCILFAATLSPSFAQERAAGATPAAGQPEPITVLYDFTPGESVWYEVATYDTLLLNGANQLLQTAEREYTVSFTCDSLVRDGFAMTMRSHAYSSRERRDTLPSTTRTSHSWLRRPLSFVMRYDGRRVRFITQIDTPSVAPGGPFQPLLLPFVGEPRALTGKSETFKESHWLLDNASPPVLWTGSMFRSIEKRVDSAGMPTLELAFAETGRARYEPANGVSTEAVTNASSRHWFAPMLGFPVAGEVHAIYNLTMSTPRGDGEGRQIVNTVYHILDADEIARLDAPSDTTQR